MKNQIKLFILAITLFFSYQVSAQYRIGYELGYATALNSYKIESSHNPTAGYTLALNYIYEDFDAGDLILGIGYTKLNFKTEDTFKKNFGIFNVFLGFAYNIIEPEDYVFQAKAGYDLGFLSSPEAYTHQLKFGVSGGLNNVRMDLMFHLPLKALEFETFNDTTNEFETTYYKPTYVSASIMFVSGF